MVKMRLTVRGGFLLAAWAAGGIFLLATFLFVVFSTGWWVWPVAAVGGSICFIALPWSYRFRDVTIGNSEIRVRAGRSFRHVRRLPRRYITGCSLLATPIQRAMGICCVVVYTPGTFSVLFGLRKPDAHLLLELLAPEVSP